MFASSYTSFEHLGGLVEQPELLDYRIQEIKKKDIFICPTLSWYSVGSAPALNSGKIQIGQNVNIKLSSYPDNEYGVLKGNVKHISLIPNSEGFYLIDINLPEKLVTTHGKEIEFKQEMQGTAEIITEDLRLIERVFYRFNEIFDY